LPSEKPARRLEDIVENAQAALRYTAGMDEHVAQALVRVPPPASRLQAWAGQALSPANSDSGRLFHSLG
jgi:hypothetical protein